MKPGSHLATNKKIFDLITAEQILDKKILDIGAGTGYMTQLLGEYLKKNGRKPAELITACDLFPEYFKYPDVVCEKMAFSDSLPFASASYDVVYAIEVLEHLQNPYGFIREILRVLKPGGKAIISVPNILNLSSRLAYLSHGFFEMFEPLSFKEEDAGRLCGHIMPLNFFYIDHSMRREGFSQTWVYPDKIKKSANLLYIGLYPLLKLSMHRYQDGLIKKNSYLVDTNRGALALINSRAMLCSRSAIIIGRKGI